MASQGQRPLCQCRRTPPRPCGKSNFGTKEQDSAWNWSLFEALENVPLLRVLCSVSAGLGARDRLLWLCPVELRDPGSPPERFPSQAKGSGVASSGPPQCGRNIQGCFLRPFPIGCGSPQESEGIHGRFLKLPTVMLRDAGSPHEAFPPGPRHPGSPPESLPNRFKDLGSLRGISK